jgi:hypothetical protein
MWKRFWVVFSAVSMSAIALAVAPSAAATPSGRVAWIGSPITGSVSSPPPHSHPYGGQWSVDIASGTTQTVKVYAAADSQRDPHLSARIENVNYACAASWWDSRNGASPSQTKANRLSRGGKVVRVGIYYDSTLIGRVWYAHVDTSRDIGNYNDAVSRWGGSVGTMGTYTVNYNTTSGRTCWDGKHAHIDIANISGRSCYWSGLTQGRGRSANDYIGYVGYNSPTAACPSGI